MFSAGAAPEMPLKLVNGSATFQGAVTGPLDGPSIEGHEKATNFVAAGRQIDRAEADVAVAPTGMAARHATVSRLGTRASGDLRVDFQDWKPTNSSPLWETRAPLAAPGRCARRRGRRAERRHYRRSFVEPRTGRHAGSAGGFRSRAGVEGGGGGPADRPRGRRSAILRYATGSSERAVRLRRLEGAAWEATTTRKGPGGKDACGSK